MIERGFRRMTPAESRKYAHFFKARPPAAKISPRRRTA
jgi:hypothetical protein